MSQQKLDLQLKGLYTSPNNLSGIPQGALAIADNVVINNKNIIDSRRGQTQYGSPLTVGSGQVNKIFNYASSQIVNYDNKLGYDSGSGVWTAYSGTYLAPATGYKMRSLEALRNFYFTTSQGIYKLDAINSTPRRAGVVRALGGTAALTGSSGFLLDNSAVAYRILWGYIDANGNLIRGTPSQRLVIANSSGGTRNVTLTFQIPDSITTEYFYQIYRSQGTLLATDTPSDELQLVIQGNPTAAEITAKSFIADDLTPYSLMREVLYTSPSLEGIENANDEPPLALDMDVFKGSAFYANIKYKQRLSLALISVDLPSFGYYVDATTGTTNASPTLTTIASTANLRVGMRIIGTGIHTDTRILAIPGANSVTMDKNATATASVSVEFQDRFTIGGVDYWGASANNVATNSFQVVTSGTPGQNINNTALNLIQIINTSASNTTLYGYYISSGEDLPGQILFEERSIGGLEFAVTSTAGESFSPNLPENAPITGISLANPTVITSASHGLITGSVITITGSDSTPTVNGEHTVTYINANTFSIPVNVTVAGTTGAWILTERIVQSDNEEQQNRVAISKPNQVEAVPSYTYFNIGAANFPIQRVVALRDGIFFFKQDGIYRLSGESFESYTVSLVDNTVTLKAPESAVPFNNQVFCFTTQGICAVTDSGVQVISVPIENTLLELSSEQFTNFASASFGVAYESARQYMFFTVTEEDDEFATQAFIYNSLTESWTRWVMDRTCGVVGTTANKLFMAQTDTGQVLIERKTFTNDDYADEQYAVSIASVDSSTLMTVADASEIEAGMTIVQGSRSAYIESIVGNQLEVTSTTGFQLAAATVFTPIDNFIQWSPIDVENPGILKQFSEITLLFRNAAFREIDAGFSTNISPARQVIPIRATSEGAWGTFPWGEARWGGVAGGSGVLRTYVPREKARGHWLNLSLRTQEAFTGFTLQGVSIMFNPMSSRFR